MKNRQQKNKFVQDLLKGVTVNEEGEEVQEEIPTDFESYEEAVKFALNKAKNFKPKADGNN